ncbi:MAG TPA: hypothetical protein PKO12_05620, partial [Holophaga sp.]|nr:hypothetical protein [Holophaga sp.]
MPTVNTRTSASPGSGAPGAAVSASVNRPGCSNMNVLMQLRLYQSAAVRGLASKTIFASFGIT